VSVWRCRVCEGVNQGGRTCTTCGAEVPRGEPVRAAVRTRVPRSRPVAPPPVPPTPRRREVPTPEELFAADPFGLFETEEGGMDFRPIPGGCLVSTGPRRRPRRRHWL
jgi:hypothetical protein